MAHPIVHIEIPADDTQAAGKFYANVFGWKLTLDEQFNYLQFDGEGGPGGAFVKTGPSMGGAPDNQIGKPLLYIGTDDIDATLAKIESGGGRVLVPQTEIPGIGWFAIFNDPQGNTLALYKSIHG
jgi:predicted enzyme related to lactoylglutathione lyase